MCYYVYQYNNCFFLVIASYYGNRIFSASFFLISLATLLQRCQHIPRCIMKIVLSLQHWLLCWILKILQSRKLLMNWICCSTVISPANSRTYRKDRDDICFESSRRIRARTTRFTLLQVMNEAFSFFPKSNSDIIHIQKYETYFYVCI